METRASFRLLAHGEQPAFRSERVAAFYRYWLDLARDGLPSRDAINPAAMLPLLPYVMLIDIEGRAGETHANDTDFRVRYRLVGTAVAKFSGRDFTNAYLDELDFNVCTAEDLMRAYRSIRDARRPGFGTALAQLEHGQVMDVEYLICPLVAAGSIRQCIALEDYMPSKN